MMTWANEGASPHSASERWYAVALQPRADPMARAHLERQGFTVFAPMIAHTVRHARQFQTRDIPLFPGYLFVRLDINHARWRSINGTRGVRGLVTTGDSPALIPERAMAELMKADEMFRPLPAGTPLEILSGPFAGLAAHLLRLDGVSRVAVLMELIGGRLSVNLPRASVRALG